jgi:proline iminopeptidase
MRRFLLSIIILILAVSMIGCKKTPPKVLFWETIHTDNIREGRINVAGGNVWFRIVGADKKGIPIIVIHGGPGWDHTYLEPLQALADERPVIFYDQLDCGQSAKVNWECYWRVNRSVRELDQIRIALNLKKAHILAHSWGTMIAMAYVLQEKHPKGIVSIVLSSPVLSAVLFSKDQKEYLDAEFSNAERDLIQNAAITGDNQSKEYKEVVDKYYKLHLCRLTKWPECLNATIEKFNYILNEYLCGPNGFMLTVNRSGYEIVEALKNTKAPVLITCGRFDMATPQSTALYRNEIPGAEILIFEDASTMHHLENTAEYIHAVRDFLHRAEKMDNTK